MTLRWILLRLALTGLLGAATLPAQAQTVRCPEGRTLAGACVDPALAALARDRAINLVNRKLSASNARNLPAQDVIYRDPAWLSHLRYFDHRGEIYIYGR
jgi:hypothetical protein